MRRDCWCYPNRCYCEDDIPYEPSGRHIFNIGGIEIPIISMLDVENPDKHKINKMLDLGVSIEDIAGVHGKTVEQINKLIKFDSI